MAYSHLPLDPTKRPYAFNFATSIVDHWAKKNPEQIALYWANQDLSQTKKLTYKHFSAQSHRIAKLFTDLGLKKGDVLVIILPRLPEWWEVATACLRAGIIIAPATTLLVPKDIEYRLQVANATAFIGDSTSVEKCLKVKSSCPSLKTIIQINSDVNSSVPSGVVDFHSKLSDIHSDVRVKTPSSLRPSTPAIIYFTSGTTGPPKIVLHTHISYPLAHTITGMQWLRLTPTPDSVYWNLSEQGWAKAAWSFFGTWCNGATLFVHDDRQPFNPKRTLEVLHKFPISTLCAPPTAYRQLVLDENRKLYEAKETGPKALRHACGAGEPLNESVIRTWKEMSGGMEICDGYGQTETVLLCGNQKDIPIRMGSMGKPLSGIPLVVIDDDGNETKADTEGDIAVEIDPPDKGDQDGFFGIFEGYVKDMKTLSLDRRLRKTKAGRKFYVTGDRATRDKDGYFWFVGRNDDVINSAGYRIGPFEVESTLKLHPSVVESAVVAAPDPQREEVVKAFVVLTDKKWNEVKDDEGKKNKLMKELQDFCKENAAPYKYPRKMEFVDSTFLPKTISGKIKRAELKKLEKERYEKTKKAKL